MQTLALFYTRLALERLELEILGLEPSETAFLTATYFLPEKKN